MQHQNSYYDVNQNPNIYPVPDGRYYGANADNNEVYDDYTRQSEMHGHFQQMHDYQQSQENQRFYHQDPINDPNLATTNFLTASNDYSAAASQTQGGYAALESYDQYNDDANDDEYYYGGGNDHHQSALQVNDLNSTATSNQAYPHVFMPQPFWQLPQKNLISDPDPEYLSIDSQDRDRRADPNPNEYTIQLVTSDTSGYINAPGAAYKNITSIELISAVIPNVNNVLDEIYLILEIPEIDETTYRATNHNLSRGFAKLMFCKCDGTNKWLRLDLILSDPLKKVFYPSPKASIERMTIRLKKRDGTLFNFGTDNSLPTDVNPDIQNSFTFKITTKVVDTEPLGHRNI